MKFTFFIFIILLSVFSCERKVKGDADATDYDDLVYTDSFSPASFEAPLSRKVIRMQDVDIGFLIDSESGNPIRRSLYLCVENFCKAIAGNGDLEDCFLPSTYNSFYLRYGKPQLEKRYRLRVGVPDNESAGMLWISYKLIVKGNSYVGKLQLSKKEESYIISDFEYQGLDDLFLAKEKEE